MGQLPEDDSLFNSITPSWTPLYSAMRQHSMSRPSTDTQQLLHHQQNTSKSAEPFLSTSFWLDWTEHTKSSGGAKSCHQMCSVLLMFFCKARVQG